MAWRSCFLCFVAVYGHLEPEQIHLAFAGQDSSGYPSGMTVSWFTRSEPKDSTVQYGPSESQLDQSATGHVKHYMSDAGFHSHVEILNLKPSTKYFYRVGSSHDSKWSEVWSFTSASTAPDASFSMAVFGDMGYESSVERPMVITLHGLEKKWSAQESRATLEKWKDEKSIDFIWHVGDIGYMDDSYAHSPVRFTYETAYNGYLNWLQNLTASMAYMVSPGNHESECHSPACEVDIDVPGLQAELAGKAEEAVRKGHRCDSSVFDGEVFCVSMPSCRSRRCHTEQELKSWGFPAPRFVDAFGPEDDEVLTWFNSPRVAKFPPCFRCGLVAECCCANNDMLQEQIANWLSFRKAWEEISKSNKEWHLLVEDDLKFTHKAAECWNELVTQELLNEHSGEPMILRCGWQLGVEYCDDDPPELLPDTVRMSNHCSLMNRWMAQELLRGSEEHICATSDVFTHEIVAPNFHHFTMFPPISYDLSFALKVPSLIRPKGTPEDDLHHAMAVERLRRVDVYKIRIWLQTLVWLRDRNCSVRGSLQCWEELCEGHEEFPVRVVCDLREPPAWVYAAYRFFVGPAAFRPRDFRHVDLEWLARTDLTFPC